MSVRASRSADSRAGRMLPAFAGILVFYWLIVYAAPMTTEVARGTVVYYSLVVPVLLFTFAGLALIAWRQRLPGRALWLLAYIMIVCAVAAYRGDIPTITSTLLTMLTIVVLASLRLTPPIALLNVLFLLSIPLNVAVHLAGYSIYSVLPGLSLDEDLPWRISLFPVVAESAFFSAVVLALNILDKEAPLRRTCLVLALYFLLLSGLRSAVIGTVLGLFYYFVVERIWSWRPRMKMVYLGVVTLAFVALLLTSRLMALSTALGSEFLNVYLFRAEGGIETEADLAKSIYRGWIWAEHARLAAENPWLGIGTYDFAEMADYEDVAGRPSSGSESFLTGLYARVGLPSLLFVMFLCASIWNGVKRGQHEQLMIGLLLVVAMLTYGSFLVPYNFVFLVMLACVSNLRPSMPSLRARLPAAANPAHAIALKI